MVTPASCWPRDPLISPSATPMMKLKISEKDPLRLVRLIMASIPGTMMDQMVNDWSGPILVYRQPSIDGLKYPLSGGKNPVKPLPRPIDSRLTHDVSRTRGRLARSSHQRLSIDRMSNDMCSPAILYAHDRHVHLRRGQVIRFDGWNAPFGVPSPERTFHVSSVQAPAASRQRQGLPVPTSIPGRNRRTS